MGVNLALNLQSKGHQVVAWNRSEEKRFRAKEQGVENVVDSISKLVSELGGEERKVIWSMISAGPAVDSVFSGEGGLIGMLSAGDIVIDGVNSHFKDSRRRAAQFSEKMINMLDVGVSGGVDGARNGACMMVGGDRMAFEHVEPVIKDVCLPDGYGYFGASGAGHYVKMVHNAIEYGMMQAIAEGMNLLELSEFEVDYSELTKVWSNGSIIESNLIKFLHKAFSGDPDLHKASPEIGSLGTAKWAVSEALESQAPFTNIANSVFTRYESREKDVFSLKIIQAMRAVFGAHSSSERPS